MQIIKRNYQYLPVSIRKKISFFRSSVSIKFYKILVYFNKKTFRVPIFFYSQQSEDKIIYKKFYKKDKLKGQGVFVELGAFDGITYSNTKFFEDTLRWRGLLIEPVRKNFQMLLKNRPDNLLVNVAVGSEKYVDFIGDYATAGRLDTMSKDFLKIWHSEADVSNKSYRVKCRTMDSLFNEFNITTIDFFSLDVEGGELDVLKTIDFSKVKINLFLIELDGSDSDKDNACREILEKNLFEFIMNIGNNDLWKSKVFEK